MWTKEKEKSVSEMVEIACLVILDVIGALRVVSYV